MLWKFYKNDPDVCHYVFGTMHLATEAAYAHVDIAKKYIQLSSIYAAELDLNEQAKHNMEQYFLLESGTFSDFFTSKRFQKYVKVAKKAFDIDLMQYNHCTPFFINTLIAEKNLEKTYAEALDHYLWNFAIAEGKDLRGVESFDDQVRILKSIPLDTQLKTFKDSMSNVASLRKKLENLNEMYKNGDMKQLYLSTKKSMGKLRKLMIYDRNMVMTNRIIEISQEKPSFFAVGAAHLPGPKGILTLLKKQGFKIAVVK
ncbi:MAG TPA: TraB/GumN family protein [Saprospiraceae bacterium]|nr:TraB/GumN family protein [Saprospiraceae bacterium]